MLFSELETICQGVVLETNADMDISRFSIDSRKILGHTSECFIAIDGVNNDAHSFLDEVHARGIRNYIVEKEIFLPESNVLKVKSSIEALQRIATFHRKKFDYPVVGITGSNGKTTVKEWLSEILAEQFKVVKSPKSYNSQVGVPLSVLEMGDHEVAVFEAGLSKGGEMQNLAKVINPTLGVFTTLGEAHDQGFSSRLQKMKEKAKLFESCELVVCRHEHSTAREYIAEKNVTISTWSFENKDANVFIELADGKARFSKYELEIELPFSNPVQLENLFHSVVCSKILGVTNNHIIQAVARLKPLPMRLQLKKAINGCQLVDDSYNNDPMGLETALDFMNEINLHQPKTVILSDMYQSSLSSNDLNAFLKEILAAKGVDRIIQIGEQLDLSDEKFKTTAEFLSNFPRFSNETILLKGSRNFAFEEIADRLEAKNHGTVLEINLEAIRRNLNAYRALTKKTRLMVMVKAFAYGAGAVEIAHLLQHEGIDYLGCAYLDEGIQLRESGITLPIMVMNPEFPDFSKFGEYDLEAEIFSLESLQQFIESGAKVGIHLKLETGMNRLGFQEEDLPHLIKCIQENPEIGIKGIFTHFSSSDDEGQDDFTHLQAEKFNRMYDQLVSEIGYQPLKHAVNSWGIVRFPEYHFDMVRLGIGMYGYYSDRLLKVEPISVLKTHISQIKSLKAGESIGYSRKGRASKDMKIAIIPIGYADGYRRAFGNGQAWVTISGEKAPTIGNICMDMTMIDVSHLEAKVGDEVVVFGERPSIEDLAKWTDTIPYEILTNVSDRVKRIFTSS